MTTTTFTEERLRFMQAYIRATMKGEGLTTHFHTNRVRRLQDPVILVVIEDATGARYYLGTLRKLTKLCGDPPSADALIAHARAAIARHAQIPANALSAEAIIAALKERAYSAWIANAYGYPSGGNVIVSYGDTPRSLGTLKRLAADGGKEFYVKLGELAEQERQDEEMVMALVEFVERSKERG